MANTIKIKRSAVSGKVPTTAQLELGELAVNTHDGKLYTKKDDGTAAVVQIGDAASTADALTTARSIALSGDVSGSTSFDGSANVTITATVADDSHNHVISNVDGLQTALDAKLPLAGGQLTGNITFSGAQTVDGRDLSVDGAKLDGIEAGATADQTASEILTAIKTVDGSGSGLDADTVDGVQASSFLRADASDTATQRIAFYANNTNSWDTIATATGSLGGIEIYNSGASTDAFMAFHVGSDYACYFGLDGGTNKLSVGGWSMGANSYAIYHEGNKPTLSELGYTGDTNANYITNNNQLTNGAGYITSSGSITGNAATATTLQTARTINGTSFNGSANITITANTSNTLSRGSYLTGSNFNGSAATTWAVDATTSSTASKIVARDGSGHIRGNYIFGAYLNMSHSQATRSSDTIFYSSTDAYLRKNTASGMRSSLSVPHLAGNNTFTLAQRGQVDALSSASTITPNFNNSNNFSISLSTNTTIANPSNLTAGQSGAIAITYNGGYTVAFGSYWKFPGGTAPTATSTSGKTDVLVYYVESSTRISAQLILNTGG